MKPPKLQLTILPGRLAVCRLGPGDPVPAWARGGALASITRTPDELSIVCDQEMVPDSVRAQRGWRCLKARGPLDLDLTGVLASLAVPLARAGAAVFALSTYDTDYLLVPESKLDAAKAALTAAGHLLEGA
jgi:hypothetical protein